MPGQGTEWAQAVWAVLLQDHTLREYSQRVSIYVLVSACVGLKRTRRAMKS